VGLVFLAWLELQFQLKVSSGNRSTLPFEHDCTAPTLNSQLL